MKETFELRLRASEKETELVCSRGGEGLLKASGDMTVWTGQRFDEDELEVLENAMELLASVVVMMDGGKEVPEYVRMNEEAVERLLKKMEDEDDG